MKNIKTTVDNKVPEVTTDPAMKRYRNVVLCPEKVEKAKKTFEKFGLPVLQKIK